jgi:hypothetical protein
MGRDQSALDSPPPDWSIQGGYQGLIAQPEFSVTPSDILYLKANDK